MTTQHVNLGFFLASLIAGVALIFAGHAEFGAPLITFAVGHAAPSPIKRSEP